ncbi:cytochrome c oxidase accessory protein CcoG [Chitinophaga sp. XS-30]|uniref:cytochrome c oxidase accessory protein CcoG n=1 Tax=Chitinophaga sp. XS-30 TaxID=2604421 RepID=UPI0011DCC029|nr:cytochrome c oxidase accessory protein CcoG [Chitinophaga sp. XS-30]QEH41000.1 cytochrome c oxidase accessory protein CcoG [Chitinophaga sp. XS-30]
MKEEEEIFRDSIATVTKQGKRKWIYAKRPKGRLFNIRSIVSYIYFIVFFSLPFIQVNGRPLFLFDVTEGRFILFGAIFWPQDFFIFGLAMVAFILFIVLFTMAFGRLFCGWVCPQTIFMEMVFRKIEYWIEGDAPAQKMLDKAPWNAEKIRKKTLKHVIFFVLSVLIANTFLAYIIGIQDLQAIVTDPLSSHAGGFIAMMVFSGVFYAVFAFFREQVCTVVCPYGRLQSVLLDKDSVVVAYDYVRGEPRGKYKKDAPELGDCIDCMQCVHVCPTGIDIRNGTQLECVNCTACIDACDFMMEKTGRPTGLIRYASENGIAKKQPLRFTPRLKTYSTVLLLITGAIVFLLISRKPVSGTIIRTAGMLYQERGLDSISNLYRIKLVNKTTSEVPLTLRLEKTPGHVETIGQPQIHIKAEGQGEGTFFVVLPRNAIQKRKSVLTIGLYQGDELIITKQTTFLGPAK